MLDSYHKGKENGNTKWGKTDQVITHWMLLPVPPADCYY